MSVKDRESFEQMDLFTDYAAKEQKQAEEKAALEQEKKMQQAMLDIKKKFGKNAILKGMIYRKVQPPATGMNKLADIRPSSKCR